MKAEKHVFLPVGNLTHIGVHPPEGGPTPTVGTNLG